jgi:alkaline phosphatase D
MIGKDSFVFKSDRPWPNKRFDKGAIIGHTTTNSTRLWIRAGRPGKFILLLYQPQNLSSDTIYSGLKDVPYLINNQPDYVRKFEFTIEDYDSDTTHFLDIDRLRSGTTYRYALYSDDEKRIILGQDVPYSFQTPSQENDSLSIALYSCHMPYKETLLGGTTVANIEMWEYLYHALERHKEKNYTMVIACGDQVYTDAISSLNIWEFLNNTMRKENGILYPSENDMVSWYRDIYRGYWGFPFLKKVFSSHPTYMIWDDHDICDGWGSYFVQEGKRNEITSILPNLKDKRLTTEDGLEFINRMGRAARRVYYEYQHSHNPDSGLNQLDYGFYVSDCAFYVLDGRGMRDVNRDSYRILGRKQTERFKAWLKEDSTRSKSFLFVVSSVPILHLRSVIVNADSNAIIERTGRTDDLRDSWENSLHDEEREDLMSALFEASKRGQKVSILSGDVHVGAAFEITDSSGNTIYQLTSSPITNSISRPLGWVLGLGVPDEGITKEGYRFERLALYTNNNFAIIRVDNNKKMAIFQLYSDQYIKAPEGENLSDSPCTHSMLKIKLFS